VSAEVRLNDIKRAMLKRLLVTFAFALVLAPGALAAGGNYTVDGGTRAQQAQVRSALNASSFNWDIVPGPVVIHVGRGDGPHAVAGEIWLDSSLLDSGRFSWGVIQHEYAHQVDFAVLTDSMRSRLATLLGGSSWWNGPHDSISCERFADAVAWAYWLSPDNVLRPSKLAADQFRSMLAVLIPGISGRSTAAVARKQHSPKG
jgi:hypothetical protein